MMTVDKEVLENEVKNFKIYKKQIHKMIFYLTKNKPNLTAHLLVRAYKYVISLGKKYAHGKVLVGFCDENPYWTCGSLGSKEILYHPSRYENNQISVYTSDVGFHLDTTSGTSLLVLASDEHGKQFVEEESIDGCDFDKTHIHVSDKTLVKDFIDDMQLLEEMLNLTLIVDCKKLKGYGKFGQDEQKKQKIENGQYSWDKIFNN